MTLAFLNRSDKIEAPSLAFLCFEYCIEIGYVFGLTF